MSAHSLETVLAPVPVEEFLATSWLTSFLRLQGPPGRFQSLITWEGLNRVLEEHRLEPPRLRLVRKSALIAPGRYLNDTPEGSRINPGTFASCLAAGATLVVDDVDRLLPSLRALAESCEAALSARVNVNLYASWRTAHGFDLHWDPHETMILQVYGRKHWKVFRPTRDFPLEDAPTEPPIPSDADLVWDGVLNEGDLIYLPRGWWHVATPLGEASLHLTVTIDPPLAVEFLHWLIDEARDEPMVRRNVPQAADEGVMRTFVADLQRVVSSVCDERAMLRFLAARKAMGSARPRVRLPAVVIEEPGITASTLVRLGNARRVVVGRIDESGTAHLSANGAEWACGVAMVPAFQLLSDTVPVTVQQLCDTLSDEPSAKSLRILLSGLAMSGVVVVESGAP